MNNYYGDILSRVDMEPLWWDENAVPRFCEFAPDCVSNIYANFAALVLIACQGCDREFKVAFSQGPMDRFKGYSPEGKELIMDPMDVFMAAKGWLSYGDPPNSYCCGAGPTMSSVFVKVLEFWANTYPSGWVRRPDLELGAA